MAKFFYNGQLSINKDAKSPYWMVSFQGPDGKTRRRSTKVPVAGGMFQGEPITAKAAERLAMKIGVQMACDVQSEYEAQNNVTVREWFNGFLQRRRGIVSSRTFNNSVTAYKHFFEFLGKRADEPMRLITKADIKAFVISRREVVRAETVDKDMGAIKMAFSDAVDSDVLVKSPAQGVTIPPDRASEKRIKEPFTMEEIRYMLDKFPPEWSSAVRCCFETFGQRLSDITKLDWSQFRWEKRCVRFVTGKTARLMDQPMRESFFQWARAKWEAAGCPASGPLHPVLKRLGDGASGQFGELLRAHGIGVVQAPAGGRRNNINSKTFHSIRSTCTTELHAAGGISETMAMELIGHESKEVHKVYLRPSREQLREVAAKLPEL